MESWTQSDRTHACAFAFSSPILREFAFYESELRLVEDGGRELGG
jgi:hypothetical protein